MSKTLLWIVAIFGGLYLLSRKAMAVAQQVADTPAVRAQVIQQQVSSVVGSTSQTIRDIAGGISSIIGAVNGIDWGTGSEEASPRYDISSLLNNGGWSDVGTRN